MYLDPEVFQVKSILFLLIFISLSAASQTLKSYEQQLSSTVKFRMLPVKAGTFILGTSSSEIGRDEDEGPQRKISMSAFWMSEKEVTFSEWDLFFKNMDVVQSKNISVDAVSRPTAQYIDLTWGMGREPTHPTNSMSHQAAMMYCKWLYEKTGVFYRLPTEAEWEYACRAGSVNIERSTLTEYAHFKENSHEKFHKTGELKPNAWGFYDMLGNLSEWTLDQYDAQAYQKTSDGTKDPLTPPASKYPKVVRGGSYLDDAKECRCGNRISSAAAWNKRDPQIPKSKWWLTDGMFVGFRVVRPVQQPSKDEVKKFFDSYLR
jgi:formylglycine-generating enzyme required for sulfatase activity